MSILIKEKKSQSLTQNPTSRTSYWSLLNRNLVMITVSPFEGIQRVEYTL